MNTKTNARIGKVLTAALVGSIVLGGFTASIAQAEAGKGDAAAVQALQQAKVSLADVIRTAEAAGQGVVTGAELRVEKDGTWFEVTTRNGTARVENRIDPVTGKIMANTPESDQTAENGKTEDHAKGGAKTHEADDLAAIQGAKVTLLQAIADAETKGGKALSAEYGSKGGTLAVEVTVADASGKTTELKVDAVTGKVIPGNGNDDDESNEAGEDHEG